MVTYSIGMAHPTDREIALAHQLTQQARTKSIPTELDWSQASVVDRGKDHRVLLLPPFALRISRRGDQDIARQVRVTQQLQEQLPWTLPTVFAYNADAVLQRYVPGTAHPHGEGDPQVLKEICVQLAQVDVTGLELNTPFAQRGRLTDTNRQTLRELPTRLAHIAQLPEWFSESVDEVLDAVDQFTDHPEVPAGLVHGDLAGHNMAWLHTETGYQLSGILDWDQAAAWDVALNPAYLSLWHGEDLLEDICQDSDEYRRARIWLAAHALDSIHNATTRGIPAGSWRRLLRKTLPRIKRGNHALTYSG